MELMLLGQGIAPIGGPDHLEMERYNMPHLETRTMPSWQLIKGLSSWGVTINTPPLVYPLYRTHSKWRTTPQRPVLEWQPAPIALFPGYLFIVHALAPTLISRVSPKSTFRLPIRHPPRSSHVSPTCSSLFGSLDRRSSVPWYHK